MNPSGAVVITDDDGSQDSVDQALARAIHGLLQQDTSLTVMDLASSLEVEEADVIRILDGFTPENNYANVGPGKGGGWIPEPKVTDEE